MRIEALRLVESHYDMGTGGNSTGEREDRLNVPE